MRSILLLGSWMQCILKFFAIWMIWGQQMIVDSKMHTVEAVCEYDRAGRIFSSVNVVLIVRKLKQCIKKLFELA